MRALALDTETVPTKAALALPYPDADRPPPSNYKSEDAIAKWREADRAAWETARIKSYSLNPRLCRVLCVGWENADAVRKAGVPISGTFYAPTEEDEVGVLNEFWSLFTNNPEMQRVVTWNGTWDLRVLILRSMHLNVGIPATAPIREWMRKYSTTHHFDVKNVLLNWPNGYPTGEGLTEWARFFGITEERPGLSGADVYPLYLGEQHEEIQAYCGGEVRALTAIYHRTHPIFG